MSGLTIRAATLDEYLDFVDIHEEKDHDRLFVLGELSDDHRAFSGDPESGFMQYNDFKYPYEWFEADTPDALTYGDTSLIGTWLLPRDVLAGDALHSDRVLTFDEFRDRVRDAAEEIGGEKEAVFVIGAHAPGSHWNRYGGKSSETKRWGGIHFPNRLFKNKKAVDPLKKSPVTFNGTAVVARDGLTDGLLAFVDGDRDEPPLGAAGEKQCMEEEEVLDVLTGVEVGDRVYINDRNAALTVVPREEADLMPSNHTICLLNGNGTSYRIESDGDGRYPWLKYTSDRELITEVELEKSETPESAKVEGVTA